MLIYLSTCQKKNQMTKKSTYKKKTEHGWLLACCQELCVGPAINGSCASRSRLPPAHKITMESQSSRREKRIGSLTELEIWNSVVRIRRRITLEGMQARSICLYSDWDEILSWSEINFLNQKDLCFFFASLLGTVLWAFDQARARKQRIDNLFSDKMVANAPHKQWQRSTVNMYAHNRLGGA